MKAFPRLPFRGVLSARLAVLALVVLPALASFSQADRKIWRDAGGKEITASFISLKDGKVRLRTAAGTIAEVPITTLSWESGREAIRLKWQLLGMADLRLSVPDHAGVSENFVKLTKVPEAEAVPEGWFRYRCANFEFDSQTELEPRFVAQTGRVFESTRELLMRLPWRIEAIPEKGPRFRALIYRDLDAYQKGGGPPGSAGVFKPSTGEFSLPLTGANNSTDTMQHELTHQMMQRLLPVIPWWVAEGTAEYVSIMKYRDGFYDCKMVSKKQVVPELQKRGPYCTENAFLSALEYRSQTQVEMILGSVLNGATRRQDSLRKTLQAQSDAVKAGFAKLEEQKQLYLKMFALEPGQSLMLPETAPPAAPQYAGPASSRTRPQNIIASLSPPGGISQNHLYAGSTMMVYYLTSLAPDQGEGFARYMWSAQQLRDEFDLSMKFLEVDMAAYHKKLEALRGEVAGVEKSLAARGKEYEAFFAAALKYSNTCGYTNEVGKGRFEFVHKPDSNYKPPVPPEAPVITFPDLPAPPAPRLTAADVQKRREELLKTLMGNSTPLDFIADVKAAAAKIGVKCGY